MAGSTTKKVHQDRVRPVFPRRIERARARMVETIRLGKWQENHLFIREDIRSLHLRKDVKKYAKKEALRLFGPFYPNSLGYDIARIRPLIERLYKFGS